MAAGAYRLASGSLIGLGLFGVVSHLLLLFGLGVPAVVLPVAWVVGLLLARRPEAAPLLRESAGLSGGMPCRIEWIVAIGLLATVAAALIYGSSAMPARDWDGFIAWELKATFLTASPTIHQDWFLAPGVFSHSRDYPLLQPLTIAAGNRLLQDGAGRLLFPLLYAMAVLLLASAVRLRTGNARLALLGATCFGVTPMLAEPTLGGFDSGYAEAFTCTVMLGAAVALTLGDARLLAATCLCAVLVKPEGLVYGALPVLVAFAAGERRLLVAAVGGLVTGSAVWLPLQSMVQARAPEAGLDLGSLVPLLGGLVVAGGGVLAFDAWLRRRDASPQVRVLWAAASLPAALLLVPVVAYAATGESGTMGVYLADPTRPLQRLARLPQILAGGFEHAFGKGKFALTFYLLALLAVIHGRRRRRWPEPVTAGFVVLGLGCCVLPFLVSPEEDTAHHLRSTMGRLLVHWTGAGWLLALLWLARVGAADESSSPPPNHPPEFVRGEASR